MTSEVLGELFEGDFADFAPQISAGVDEGASGGLCVHRHSKDLHRGKRKLELLTNNDNLRRDLTFLVSHWVSDCPAS